MQAASLTTIKTIEQMRTWKNELLQSEIKPKKENKTKFTPKIDCKWINKDSPPILKHNVPTYPTSFIFVWFFLTFFFWSWCLKVIFHQYKNVKRTLKWIIVWKLMKETRQESFQKKNSAFVLSSFFSFFLLCSVFLYLISGRSCCFTSLASLYACLLFRALSVPVVKRASDFTNIPEHHNTDHHSAAHVEQNLWNGRLACCSFLRHSSWTINRSDLTFFVCHVRPHQHR